MTERNLLYDLPTLETDRLELRKLSLDDADDVFAYGSNPNVSKYVSWVTHASIEDSREFLHWAIEQYSYGEPSSWGIVHKDDNKLIGTIGFVYVDWHHGRAEFGYALAEEYWNQGITTEAAKQVIHFGFRRMDLHRIEARCTLHNVGSARVLEKSGMTFEGILRHHMFAKGQYHDVRMYSILANEI